MSYQFSGEIPQGYTFATLEEAMVPAVSEFAYATHAPYERLAAFPTLFLGGPRVGAEKFDAKGIASYVPREFLQVRLELSRPVSRLSIDEEFGNPFNALDLIGGIELFVTMREANITFIGHGRESEKRVEIPGLTAASALIGANGLSKATANKLSNMKRAGHDLTKTSALPIK